MKKLGCKDMGLSCPFVATGETAEEVKGKLNAHAAKAHADMMKNMSQEDMKKMSERMDRLLAKQK